MQEMREPTNYAPGRIRWLLVSLLVLFVLVWQAPPLEILRHVDVMPLWLHALAEIFSSVVAMLMFGIVWNAYSKERAGNMVFLGCAFLAVGLIDLAHMLSYRGMPDFITPSGAQKAINFWLAARVIAAGALLVVAVRPWKPLAHSATRHLYLGVSLAVTVLIYWLGLFHQELWPVTFIEGKGLTPFKVHTEYAVIAMLAAAAMLFYRRATGNPSFDAGSLFAVAVVSMLSEFSFTLYTNVSDLLNLLGHCFKIVAYLFLYRAAFVASVRAPFRRMYAEIAVRKHAQDKLRQLNQSLELRVAQRTVELEQANKELEAFSYSVSHDLRAPLRAIEGFSQILQRSHKDALDDKGRDYLDRVSRAGRRMGELIDDMLHLSRVSRQQIAREPVDVSRLAHEIADNLLQAGGGRRAAFLIEDGIRIRADAKLIRIVLENLIGNAWKFTGRTADASIEVGRAERDGETAIFVRDNGAGFSMAYAHKLFNPFQRLHSGSEFEGSGIGLATVHRIVSRHGGRVWADGTEGSGATFYFSCGQEAEGGQADEQENDDPAGGGQSRRRSADPARIRGKPAAQ